jgi:hypothetical protein
MTAAALLALMLGVALLARPQGPSVAQLERAIVGMLASERGFSRDPALVAEIARAIHAAATVEGLDPALLLASGWTESRFNPAAVSSIGALGIWQQLPQYGQRYADRCWDDTTHAPRCSWAEVAALPPDAELYTRDVAHAARIAARHFGYLFRRYGDAAICHYAAGGRGADCAAGAEYRDKINDRMVWARSLY